MNSARELNNKTIVDTATLLERRIAERFPGSGLQSVAGEVVSIGADYSNRSIALARPKWIYRLATFVLIAIAIVLLSYVILDAQDNLSNAVQSSTAVVATLLVLVAGVVSLEERYRRRRALKDLESLRALCHVIDMHTMTKDPTAISSPRTDRQFTAFELVRYLDYCSELLGITAKIAVIYGSRFDDAAILNSVRDVEQLTTDLKAGIWQKISLVMGQSAQQER